MFQAPEYECNNSCESVIVNQKIQVKMSLQNKLKGTGVALITPFTSNGDIDFDALHKVINHVIDGGVEYVITLGTTGETPTLDKFEKVDLIKLTCKIVDNRVPVVVGVGGNNTKELLED